MILDKIEYTKEKLRGELKRMKEKWDTTIFPIETAANFILRYKMIEVIIKSIDELQEKGKSEEETLNALLDNINDDMDKFLDELLKNFSW